MPLVAARPRRALRVHHQLENVSRTGEDRYRASGRIDGNFPGGTARLNWDFTIAGELIRRLEIAP